jgi:hypothetical protein
MKIKNTLAIFLALMIFIPAVDAAEPGGWKLKKKNAGIEVYVREVPGSEFKEFKGIMYLKGVRLGSLLAAFDDTPAYPAWMHKCIEAKLLKRINLLERITYTVTGAPWPVSDRDIISHSIVTQDPKTLAVTIQLTGRADYLPPVPKRVRVPKLNAVWIFRPMDNGEIMVYYQLHSDPGGALSAGLSNMASVDLPYYTLFNLRDFIRQEKYAGAVYPQVIEPKPAK